VNPRELRSLVLEQHLLVWHLQHNHEPAVSLIYLPLVHTVLRRARRGEFDSLVQIPIGNISLPAGKQVPVWKVLDWFHLYGFLDPQEA
jgi:hypothetical protein